MGVGVGVRVLFLIVFEHVFLIGFFPFQTSHCKLQTSDVGGCQGMSGNVRDCQGLSENVRECQEE